MRRHLREFLSLFLLAVFTVNINAQERNVEPEHNSNLIKGFESNEHANKKRSAPMVIGPDLYNQMGDNAGYLIVNNSYSYPAFSAFDAFAADDFMIPEGETWQIEYIKNLWYVAGSTDSISSVNILIYANDNGKPGTLLEEFTKVDDIFFDSEPLGYGYMTEVTITLPSTATMTAGTYWLCVQANTDITSVNVYNQPSFYSGIMPQPGEVAFNSDAHFKQPGGGFVPFYAWTSATDYSPYWGGEPGIPYMPNYNFGIYGPAENIDLAVTEILSPVTDGSLSDSENVIVMVQNHGITDVETYEIRYRVNGSDWVTETGLAVASGEELEYNFHTGADLSASGDHIVEVELILATDNNQSNNILTKDVTNYGTILPALADAKVVYEVCEGTFTDHGGLNDVYVGYSNDTIVFKPAIAGHRIRLEFYDTGMSGAYPFRFYNGSSVNAPELGDWEALNSSEGIYTQEVHGLVLEGVNPEGAITVLPPGFDINSGANNYMAKVTCVANEEVDFKVMKLETSKDLSWEKETIELTAYIKNRGSETSGQLVTFFADDTELATVSSTILAFGETGIATLKWTPETAGVYTLKAEVPEDDGTLTNEKLFSIKKEIFEQGTLLEGFEEERFPPELWVSKKLGGTSRNFIWYNNRPDYQGKWDVYFGGDTLITPRLDIKVGDKLNFIFDAGFFGGTCEIMYAESIDGRWTILHTVDYGWPWATDYQVDLTNAAGVHYLAFKGGGCTIDYVRGPKLHFYENDLLASEFNGPEDPQVNNEAVYSLKVKNLGSGALAASDYTVKLWKDADGVVTELASVDGVEITLSNTHTFELPVTFTEVQDVYVYATVEYVNDQDQTNNTSNSKNIAVLKEGIEYVYVGNVESDITDYYALADYYANYTEIIYNKEDLNVKGEISGISVYYMSSFERAFDLKIYIGETELDNLESEFLSTSAMDEVVTTKFMAEVTNNQFVQKYIEFDKPYLYSGDKNLIIGLYRPFMYGEGFGGTVYLKATPVENYVERWHGFQQSEIGTDVSNPDELNQLSGQVYKEVPNITFYVKTTDMDASLAGTVKDENSENYEGALIALEGYANTTLTGANGQYSFPVIPAGIMDVYASAYGYYNDSIEGIFTNENETIVDFNLVKLPPVQVTGNIIGNDLQQPLEDVEVMITGYGLELSTFTDVDGNFTIADLFADQKYEIKYIHNKYIELSDSIFVPIEGLNVGTIELDEIETPAFNLIASITETETVELSWQTPYTGVESMVDPTLGVAFGQYWYNEPDEDVQLGNLFRVSKPGTVTAIEFSNYAWPGAQSGELSLRFYNLEREEIMEPVSFEMPDSTVDWLAIEVPNFSYTDDFYVTIHWDKVHQQTGALMSHEHNDDVAYLIDGSGNWMLLSDIPGLNYQGGAFSIRAQVIEEGFGTGTRELVSYDLWRSPLSEVDSEENWTKMNDEPIAGTETEVTFTDESFAEAPDDYYIYILETQYSLANAPYLYSNSINKGLFAPVTINVTANNTQDITGAHVVFENENGAAVNTYIGDVAGGKVEFPNVRKGTYSLTITKGKAYEAYHETNVVVDGTLTLDVELLEYIFTPTMLRVEANEEERSAYFSWGLGDVDYIINDDNSFEQALSIGTDGDAELGNYFNVNAAGQLMSAEIIGFADNANNPNNEMGLVTLVVYNNDQEVLGKSLPFAIQPDSTFIVDLDFFEFNGPFYLMVKWSSDELLNTHVLGVDTDSDPGSTFYYDEENGFVQMAEWGYYGHFSIRANVLINGKKSSLVSDNLSTNNTNVVKPNTINAININKTVASEITRAVLSFNIFLNDMTTPIAEGVTSQSFTFNKTDHFNNFASVEEFEAGVQAVYYTGKSIVVSVPFNLSVGVLNELDSKLNVYPNPTSENIFIQNAENGKITIYNSVGEIVKTIDAHSSLLNLNISGLQAGTYIIQIEFKEGNVYRNMVITK